MIKSRRNPGGTGGNCRPKLFLSQLFLKAKASVLEDALKSVWLKCLRVAVRPRTMNPWGLDGGVASLPCSHDSPVNCDYHPNTHCDKISLPLLAVWSSKNRLANHLKTPSCSSYRAMRLATRFSVCSRSNLGSKRSRIRKVLRTASTVGKMRRL